ncbi:MULTISPECIES: DUF1405 domain-containing protein [Halorussus]|uniref:DUF1405 domain-containing protein n=1 Tax=Halorussus TaxID=1070314 RepID=UPI00209EFACB|nr:DUF1405 domain-containing protein [Halorussus vallis]USZ77142.1 DUF1405 domain-containing protein [Halorussus vallis]
MATALPDREHLPFPLAPLPDRVEDFGLRFAWVIVAINLVGTAFGFWYYRFQFAIEPQVMWPLIPDSPVATLFIAGSLALWKLGRSREWLNALAFFGCLKLGLWTPFVLLAFADAFSYNSVWMYNFLFWSHLGMVAEAFLIHRYSDFPVWAVAVAVVWYGFNDLVDYFVPLVGDPHHTTIPAEWTGEAYNHAVHAHDVAAAGAVVITLLATFLAMATRVKKLEAE